jgi:integron integrase
MRHYHIRTEEA